MTSSHIFVLEFHLGLQQVLNLGGGFVSGRGGEKKRGENSSITGMAADMPFVICTPPPPRSMWYGGYANRQHKICSLGRTGNFYCPVGNAYCQNIETFFPVHNINCSFL